MKKQKIKYEKPLIFRARHGVAAMCGAGTSANSSGNIGECNHGGVQSTEKCGNGFSTTGELNGCDWGYETLGPCSSGNTANGTGFERCWAGGVPGVSVDCNAGGGDNFCQVGGAVNPCQTGSGN